MAKIAQVQTALSCSPYRQEDEMLLAYWERSLSQLVPTACPGWQMGEHHVAHAKTKLKIILASCKSRQLNWKPRSTAWAGSPYCSTHHQWSRKMIPGRICMAFQQFGWQLFVTTSIIYIIFLRCPFRLLFICLSARHFYHILQSTCNQLQREGIKLVWFCLHRTIVNCTLILAQKQEAHWWEFLSILQKLCTNWNLQKIS